MRDGGLDRRPGRSVARESGDRAREGVYRQRLQHGHRSSLDGAPLHAEPAGALAPGGANGVQSALHDDAEGHDKADGKLCGGTIVFGGGLPLYKGQTRIGGLGVSGDTACADHEIAKTLRDRAGMNPPSGARRPTTSPAAGWTAHRSSPTLSAWTRGATERRSERSRRRAAIERRRPQFTMARGAGCRRARPRSAFPAG